MRKYIPNTYIALWLLYFLQGVVYTRGSFVSQTLLVLLLSVSLYYFAFANVHYQLPKPMRILSLMIVIWTIYGIFPLLFGIGQLSIQVAPFEYIKNIYMSVLPIYAFYVFVRKGWLTEIMLKRWMFLFILVAISSFYKTERDLMQAAIEKGSTAEEFTNGAGYIVLSVLPLLPLFWKKPILQYILMGLCMVYVLMGFKRGAIVAGVLCCVWMIYESFKTEYSANSKANRKRIIRLVLTVAVIIGAVFLVEYYISTSDYFNYRLQTTLDGYSSERDNLYSFFLHHFLYETNLFEFLFGLGANGTLKIYTNVAHNDWLEIATDNGLIPLIVYCSFWISLISYFFKGKKSSVPGLMLGMFIIIYFFRAFFSFAYSDISMYSACAFGYALANYQPNNRVHSFVDKSNKHLHWLK